MADDAVTAPPSAAAKRTPPRPSSSRVRSRGQLARRESFTRHSDDDQDDNDGSSSDARKVFRRGTNPQSMRYRRPPPPAAERPVLGGLTVFDILFIAIAYGANLVRTLGIAELADVAFQACVYCVTSLPFDFYRRWTLSHPQPPPTIASSDDEQDNDDDEDNSDIEDLQQRARTRPHPIVPPPQLSPFHHLVILLTRFACSHFPHLLPRVLFADQTMLPFVGWRTGGASWSLMREISSPTDRKWRAVWMGADAFTPSETRRSDAASREASTILYLHGGGFSLGSVSFYAEALLRVLNKVAAVEVEQGHAASNARARCIAVEYDLSPAVRFPSPLLQCLRCYAHLVEVEKIDPRSITFAGDSAGGNIAMSMLLVLSGQGKHQPELAEERDWSQLPLPGKAVLISPWVDLRPANAHAFAPLRSSSGHDGEGKKRRSKEDALADSITDYDWDYVASESLLHFAQVYAGVLERPRRVIGPMGWLANLCGVLGQGLEAERAGTKRRSSGRKRKPTASDRVLDPPRRLARAVQDALEQPVFETLLAYPPSRGNTSSSKRTAAGKSRTKSSKRDQTQSVSSASTSSTASSSSSSRYMPSLASSLMPLFSPFERKTDKVKSTSQLYAPLEGAASSHAQSNLSSNPLLSPILGDWTKVRLERGALVTWGERERLSADIESWAELVHSGRPSMSKEAVDAKDVPPLPDGAEERERERRLEMGNWLLTAVEHGPGGVHAWPYVAMYLAGTEPERERGLETLARFIARPAKEAIGGVEDTKADEVDPHWGLIDQEAPNQDDDDDGNGLGSPTFFTSRASREAASGRPFSEEEYKAAFGLGVQYAHDWSALTPSGSQTPQRLVDEQVQPVGWHAQHGAPYQYHYGPEYDDDYDESTRGCLHAAAARRQQQARSLSQPPQPQHAAVEQWEEGEEEGEGEGEEDCAEGVGVEAQKHSSRDEPQAQEVHSKDDQANWEDEASSRLSDDESPETNIPDGSLQDDQDDDEDEEEEEEEGQDVDPSQFGLTWASAPYSRHRAWGEGLSDISEEGSVLSASPTSPSSFSPVVPRPDTSREGFNRERSPPPALVLSPETRRFIRLEAQRQLAEEGGLDDDGDEYGLFSPVSDLTPDDIEPVEQQQSPRTPTAGADASTDTPVSPSSLLSRSSSRGSNRGSSDAWWAS